MGKTSLALKAAREQLNQFKDGIWFVPFVSISHPEQMLYAITDALNLFSTQQDLKTHLHSFLKDKKLLLVLDNLEHLTSGLTLISELLENAAGIKVLATSREQLQLRAEWLFDLSGLSYPATNNLDNAKTYDAVELFLQKAERIDSEINSEQLNLQEITRICQLVEGMPLAIELAASWLRILTLEEILSELEQGINLLEASIRDTPERHQSIRAVFDYSWHLLNTTQKRSLTALSVFRGGFARDAAQHVSGVTVRGLLELVSKSLLRRNQSGRFDFHPLIRQYAEEKARRTLELHIKTIAKHASFYLELMHGQVERLKQGQQKEALETMDQDIENIKQAWLWAINHNEVNSLIQLCDAMQIYHGQRNKISEGISVFEMLIDNLDASKTKNRVAIGRALVSQGWLTYRLAAYEKAIQLSQKAIDLFQAENNFQGIMRALNTMGVSHRRLGRLEPARVCLSEAVKLAKDQDSQRLQANYMQNLANLELEEGKVKQAEALYSQAQSLQQALNNHRAVVSLLLNRSLLLEHQGRFKESKSLQLEGLKLARQMNFQQTLPYLLNGLGF